LLLLLDSGVGSILALKGGGMKAHAFGLALALFSSPVFADTADVLEDLVGYTK
jgi:hypothetical protein